MKSLLLSTALILIGGVAAVTAAQAATLAYTPGLPTGIFFDTNISGGFTDSYSFSIVQTSTVSVSLSSTPYANLTLKELGIFDAANHELTTFTQGPHMSALGAGTDVVTLAAGTYAIGVAGDFVSTGSYTGVLSVGSVPLPSSVALFGLALLGLAGVGLGRAKRTTGVAA